MTLWILIATLLCFQATDDSENPLPDWTHAPNQTDLFIVQTEPLPTRMAADEGLLQAAKAKVIAWSVEKWGDDCRETLEEMPLEEYRKLIHNGQEFIHKERIEYDEETAERLNIAFDDLYRGFMRIEIGEEFCTRIEPMLAKQRLRHRLSATLIAAMFLLGLLSVLWLQLYMGQVSRGLYVGRIRWITWGLVILLLVICYSVYQLLF